MTLSHHAIWLNRLRALLFVPLVAVATAASAFTEADYTIHFGYLSPFDKSPAVIFTEPVDEFPAEFAYSGRVINLAGNFPAGAGSLDLRPVFFNDRPADTPVVSVIYGLTTLDEFTGAADLTDISALHLVLGLDSVFAATIVGQDFATAFASFTPSYFPSGTTETDFIKELLYIGGLDGQYGLPPSPFGGPQTNLLFDFGTALHTQGAAIASSLPFLVSRPFTLLSFSQAQVIGTGQAQAQPLPSAVPEPATWLMLILGFGAIGVRQRLTAPISMARRLPNRA